MGKVKAFYENVPAKNKARERIIMEAEKLLIRKQRELDRLMARGHILAEDINALDEVIGELRENMRLSGPLPAWEPED